MSTREPVVDSAIPQDTVHPVQTQATILLVEDDAAVRRYLELILRRAGYTVLSATNGLEAIKVALASTIDAVVTDAVMPLLNGHELCRHLRARPELSRLPILLLSGLDRNVSATDTGEYADAHLTKPVRPIDLINCLARLLVAGK